MSHPKAVNPQRWFRAWRDAGRPAPDTDPADFGTAFGLEMSMAETPAETAPAASRRPGWVRRLSLRRRPTT